MQTETKAPQNAPSDCKEVLRLAGLGIAGVVLPVWGAKAGILHLILRAEIVTLVLLVVAALGYVAFDMLGWKVVAIWLAVSGSIFALGFAAGAYFL